MCNSQLRSTTARHAKNHNMGEDMVGSLARTHEMRSLDRTCGEEVRVWKRGLGSNSLNFNKRRGVRPFVGDEE